jgi:hypothetical protein
MHYGGYDFSINDEPTIQAHVWTEYLHYSLNLIELKNLEELKCFFFGRFRMGLKLDLVEFWPETT